MKTIITIVSAAFLATSFGFSANAMMSAKSSPASAQMRKDCKAQAAKKFTAVHFIKRNKYVSACMKGHAAKKV
jgi:hypothetical protein